VNEAQDTHETAVHFRKWDNGDIIAIFPNEKADMRGNVMSYEHVGQHGGASPKLIRELKPAKPNEYAELKNELEKQIGYKLKVLK